MKKLATLFALIAAIIMPSLSLASRDCPLPSSSQNEAEMEAWKACEKQALKEMFNGKKDPSESTKTTGSKVVQD